jgi:quinol monooxygenase YgiN
MTLGYLLEIDCQLRSENRREFTLSSMSLMQHTGEGHRRTVIYQDRDQPDHVLWVEEWNDAESVNKYLASEGFLALQGALKTLGSISACRVVEMGDSESISRDAARRPARTKGWFGPST